jgi:hypothetical protein
MHSKLVEKIIWAFGGGVVALLLVASIGGVYTITPPNGPVDVAYKINRFTGRVWLIKTYAKPMAEGQLRVISARQAEVEKTRDLSEEDAQALVVGRATPPTVGSGRR